MNSKNPGELTCDTSSRFPQVVHNIQRGTEPVWLPEKPRNHDC